MTNNRQNQNGIARSAVSGGAIQIVRDRGAGRIVDSRRAYDVGLVEIAQHYGKSDPVNRKNVNMGRPYQFYWGADSDVNYGGDFYGFFASVFPTVYAGSDGNRLAYQVGSMKRTPITGKALDPRFDIYDRSIIYDLTSVESEREILSRTRELPVKRVGALTVETSSRNNYFSLEEGLLIAAHRGDGRHSNLIYDVDRSGELDKEMIARLSDIVRVSVNERNRPAGSVLYGSSPDDRCVGYGMVYDGIPAYMSLQRGGPIFVTSGSKAKHGGNVEGEDIVGAVLKLHTTISGSATKGARAAAQSGTIHYASAEKQGPIHYDGRNYRRGKGVRIVEAWLAYDPDESFSYGSCDGPKDAKGVFKFNSWVNVFDPYGPPTSDPPPPTDNPPADTTPPDTFPDTGLGDITGGSPSSGGDVVRRFGDPKKKHGDPEEYGDTGRNGAPATGVAEERRPSHSGIPIPPAASKPKRPAGRRTPITGAGKPSAEERKRRRDEERRRIRDSLPPEPDGSFPWGEDATAAEEASYELLPSIEPSAVERSIGVEYERLPPGQHIANTVYYDRFTYDQSQVSLRNLVRAPHGAHLQLLAKFDSDATSWVTDGNLSAYADYAGDGIKRGDTLTSTWMVMNPNTDLGDDDINPSSGVSVTGLAVHRGDDNGYIGVGVPDYSTGLVVDGFRMTYDSDGVKVVAYDSSNAQDDTAGFYFNGVEIGHGGVYVGITAAGATHNGAWGEDVVINNTTGSGDITVNVPAVGADETNLNKTFTVQIRRTGVDVVVAMDAADTVFDDANTAYVAGEWTVTSSNTGKISIHAGDERHAFACCVIGGTLTEPE